MIFLIFWQTPALLRVWKLRSLFIAQPSLLLQGANDQIIAKIIINLWPDLLVITACHWKSRLYTWLRLSTWIFYNEMWITRLCLELWADYATATPVGLIVTSEPKPGLAFCSSDRSKWKAGHSAPGTALMRFSNSAVQNRGCNSFQTIKWLQLFRMFIASSQCHVTSDTLHNILHLQL